jgi:predicted permease
VKSLRASVQSALGAGGRTQSQSRERRRTHQSLVVAQVALALVLLVASGLMIRTFGALRSVDPGFTGASELQTMRITIPFRSINEPERATRLQHDIAEKLATIPGVRSVAFSSPMPIEGLPPNISPLLVEQPAPGSSAAPGQMFKFVSPGYFQTLGAPVIAGREFTWTDLYELRPVGIVSESLARQVWGTPAEALGKHIRSVPTKPWREVVGVVADVRELGLHEAAPTVAYWPTLMDSLYEPGTSATRAVTFTLRSAQAGTETLLSQVRQAVWSVSSSLPVASARTLQDIYDESMARTSFTLVMLTIAGAMALVLAVVGLYGAISYAATERRREIGIRLALGAQPFEIRRTFLRQGLTLAGIGGLIGVGAALGLTRVMDTLLFEVNAVDPLTYVGVALVLTGAATLASYVPAWRASRRSPVEVLSAE